MDTNEEYKRSKQLEMEWQLQWHDYFDRDESLNVPMRPETMPDMVLHDLRLKYGIHEVSEDTRRKCFNLFPNGEELNRRYESYFSNVKWNQFKQEEAISLMKPLGKLVAAANPSEEVMFDNVQILKAHTEEWSEVIYNTGSISNLFEWHYPISEPTENLPAEVASYFLTEPLVFITGNFYELRNWVIAAMYCAEEDRVYEQLYKLWRSGWTVAIGNKDVYLVDHRKHGEG